MEVPFFHPNICEEDIDQVVDVLRSGWITTGPVVKKFEEELACYSGSLCVVCLSSATSALEIALRLYGIGPQDEVITTPYTYAATANVILHLGATPVFVDVAPQTFHIDISKIAQVVTTRTKAIIPVDIGGWPCDYQRIKEVLEENSRCFHPVNEQQEFLKRPLILADASHSLGSVFRKDRTPTASLADMTAFSFHAVKNLTTGEGGALCFSRVWKDLDRDLEKEARLFSLHGQTKDALSKQKIGEWRYDIVIPGFKYNMTDMQAALGLSQLKRYENMLTRRRNIFDYYTKELEKCVRSIVPPWFGDFEGSYHLYLLRVSNCSEQERDFIISELAQHHVYVNVHYQPLPLLTVYQKLGYRMSDYPCAYEQYRGEITLPVYVDLQESQIVYVVDKISDYLR